MCGKGLQCRWRDEQWRELAPTGMVGIYGRKLAFYFELECPLYAFGNFRSYGF